MKNYIGKTYHAIDNSYSINLSEPLIRDRQINLNYINSPYLAGTQNTEIRASTIITEPFKMRYKQSFGSQYGEHDFVIVSINDTGEAALVMFFESGVQLDKLEKLGAETVPFDVL